MVSVIRQSRESIQLLAKAFEIDACGRVEESVERMGWYSE
jgi:hypothetical protein